VKCAQGYKGGEYSTYKQNMRKNFVISNSSAAAHN
jgi:hypothetical protein